MAQPNENQPNFASIFANPTIDRMLNELNPYEFEDFVAYVLRQAGYIVEDTATQFGEGLDLKLYSAAPARTLQAGVSIKQFRPPATVTGPQVMGLRGALAGAGGIPGYVITTSGFRPQALEGARRKPRIWPIDGEHFVRYINYVRGSRSQVEDTVATNTDPSLPDDPVTSIAPEVFQGWVVLRIVRFMLSRLSCWAFSSLIDNTFTLSFNWP